MKVLDEPVKSKECDGSCFTLDDSDKRFVRLQTYIAEVKDQRGTLIGILHKAQEIYGFLPEELQTYIAEQLDVPLSEVCGVVTFYSYFTMKPRGRYLVSVCLGTACYVKGAGEIFEKLSRQLNIRIGETTEDGMFTLEASRCIGACGLAPVLTVNDEIHGRLSLDDVDSLLDKYKEGGQADGDSGAGNRQKAAAAY